jgi:hypothetical protein
MAYKGRIEAKITLSANLTASVTDTGGSGTATITAGTYYLTTLIDAFNTACDAIGNGLVEISKTGLDEDATGLLSVHAGGAQFSITWTSTGLRDLFGFTGNFAAVTAVQTASKAPIGSWLPDVVKFSRHGDGDDGTPVSDFRQTVGPTGSVYTMYGNRYSVLDGIAWQGVSGRKARKHLETYTNESWESFLLNCQFGVNQYFLPGAPVRLYWSASDDADYAAGTLLHPSDFDPDTLVSGWNGRYVINLPRLVLT